jgi:hypothetical protein
MYSFRLEPVCGWKSFNDYDRLNNSLCSCLKLKEHGEGNWVYFSLTNWSQVWDLEEGEVVVATVSLTTTEEDEECVNDLTISMNSKELDDVCEIKALLEVLSREFDMIVESMGLESERSPRI